MPGDIVTPGGVIEAHHPHVGWYYTWAFEMNAAGTFFAARRSLDKFHVGEVGLVIGVVSDSEESYACVLTPRGVPGYISAQIVEELK
jgi:hypothetical protein